ncbi:Z-DNA-binding protein 1 isoform X2 [Phacochoerus africanus]|uniref:Z-DNA-binding protein 1 isoform X2 n=1 Tax=Phacochoerus africanus TaxID=41426 RepID=UPI001FDA6B1A|nr:Z-DNA-binding protein 1 isoform X2 [Phacochoerus africanus]
MESEQATVPKAPRLPAAAADVAETPADPEDADLEQRILQVLRDAGSPVRTAQLVIKCQVPKKKLNQVLHQMKKESRGGLTLVGPATWCLGDAGTDGTREVVLAEQERPRQDAVAIPRTPGPRTPGPELSERQTEIYGLLKAQGPHKALHIAQALGMKTAKEVNRDLYAMRNMHLLTLDQKSNAWGVYQPEDSRNQSTPVIYQQNPINMIYQKGLNNRISIENSENIQIGHGNVIMRHESSGESGSMAAFHLPPTVPADSSAQGPLAGSWGPQDICMEKSVLRRVQMGHGNEMRLHSFPAEGPAHSACGSPPGSVSATSPEASIDIQIPEPGPHAAEGVMAQKVRIRSCFLEDTTVGNSNRMSVSPGTAGPGGVSGPEEGRADPGEPGEDPDSLSGAARCSSQVLPDGGQAAPSDAEMLTSQLEALTLRSRGPRTTEDGH